jgi:hypothetical protein
MLRTSRRQLPPLPWAFEMPVRIVKTRSELEDLLLGYLRDAPNCKEASDVCVQRVERRQNGANWTVRHFNSGRALQDSCARAMRAIVPLVQRHFDLGPDA